MLFSERLERKAATFDEDEIIPFFNLFHAWTEIMLSGCMMVVL
jgi:hypothetical protein